MKPFQKVFLSIKKTMPPRQYVVGAIMMLGLCIVTFCVYNPDFMFNVRQKINCSQKVEEQLHDGDARSQIAAEMSMELAHTERKQLLNDSGIRTAALNVLTPWLAPIIWDGIYDLNILNEQHKNTRIGLFVFAVKKYIQFLGPFLESAERFFMVGHNVTYYVFTDRLNEVVKPNMGDGRILQLHKVSADQRWQDVSMRRIEILTVLTKQQLPKEIDYLVCADVDMVFNDHMGVEILGDLIATLHPGFFLVEPHQFSYERRPISAAYIPFGKGDFYYMAALYGGKVEEIHKLSIACQHGIMEDKKKEIEAVWQEESHLNRYLVYNKPTKVLSPEYLWDTDLPNSELIKRRRFLAVHKNHKEVRN